MGIITKAVFSIIGALALWGGAFSLRSKIIIPRCSISPENCSPESLWFIDQFSVGRNVVYTDFLSFVTQDTIGIFALILPFLIYFSQKRSSLKLNTTLRWAVLMSFLFIFSALFNGFINEIVRLLVQRPRPFVYQNPSEYGLNPAHYTSFYSGHTSFAAVAFYSIRKSSNWIQSRVLKNFCLLTALLLFVFTGLFRVLAGRHFTTDILAGGFAGLLVSFLIHRYIGSRITKT